jgi:hypothetical protein
MGTPKKTSDKVLYPEWSDALQGAFYEVYNLARLEIAPGLSGQFRSRPIADGAAQRMNLARLMRIT